MSNTFGSIFKLTSFGESHGSGIGGVIDGVPAQLRLTENDIQLWLDKRKPKAGISTPRTENDKIKILSGIFEGFTTGTPIGFFVENKNCHSDDYKELSRIYRPGHADITYQKKYGIRDWRGGGRSSARETVARVVGGAIADKILKRYDIELFAGTSQIGNCNCDSEILSYFQNAENNKYWVLDERKIDYIDQLVSKTKEEEDSLGGIVRILVKNVPIGLGNPVFDKLDARLAYALMGVGAVKGVEIGSGFSSALSKGSLNNDRITIDGFETNHSGGILGGISTGQDILINVAVKPIPSIGKNQQTIDMHTGNCEEISIKGRHDICAIPRINIVLLSMVAMTLADFILLHNSEKI